MAALRTAMRQTWAVVTLVVSGAVRFTAGAARRGKQRAGHAPSAARPSLAARPESAVEQQADEPVTEVAGSELHAVEAAEMVVDGAVAGPRVPDEGALAPSSVRSGDDLDELTKAELYRRAQKANLAGRSTMNKAELIEALRTSQSAG
ncbi:MAG: Rho termination factor N-terminal domain-containing protein [Acidimicrobiales bacterium]